jgi:hypothetical protein
LEWIDFTLNNVSQNKRNTQVQLISSCCNLLICTILQTKASPQLTSFFQVTSMQLNIYDECVQHAYTPQMPQIIFKCSPSRMSHLKEHSFLRQVHTNNYSANLNERSLLNLRSITQSSPSHQVVIFLIEYPILKERKHHPSHLVTI